MADKTLIAWTDHTWNPWMGCARVSQGCVHCYAETLTKNRMGIDVWGPNGRRQRTGKAVWARPLTWNRDAEAEGRAHRVFCASLADVFEDHEGPNEWRADVFDRIRETPWLDYQLLTKRPENIERMLPDDWGEGWPNVWLGTSIEDNRVAERAPILTAVPAIVHFVSYEPAIGPLDELDLNGIEWMIVGGESGPGHRKMDLAWARDMQRRCAGRPCWRCDGHDEGAAGPISCDACDSTGVDSIAFFFKQDSGYRTEMGIDALGGIFRDYPEAWDRAERPVVPGAGRPYAMVEPDDAALF